MSSFAHGGTRALLGRLENPISVAVGVPSHDHCLTKAEWAESEA